VLQAGCIRQSKANMFTQALQDRVWIAVDIKGRNDAASPGGAKGRRASGGGASLGGRSGG
jgi:hypothetical protein